MGFIGVKQSWMCKRVGTVSKVPECDVGAGVVGGCLTAAWCEDISLFPVGGGGFPAGSVLLSPP